MMPAAESAIVMAGPAPSARSRPVSSAWRRICRLVTWMTTNSSDKAASPPNTASATDTGLTARSAAAMAGPLVWKPPKEVTATLRRPSSDSTACRCALPPTSFSALVE